MTNGLSDSPSTAASGNPSAPTGPSKIKRWALPGGALLLGLLMGGAIGGPNPTETNEYRALQAQLAAVDDQAQLAEDRASAAEDRASAAEDRAKAAEEAARLAASEAADNGDAQAGESTSPSAAPSVVDFTMPDLVGMDLQSAQNAIQAHGVFFSTSHDLLGSRQQVMDSNWAVCTQNVPAGQQVTGDVEGAIDLGVVKRGEACP